MHLTQTCLSRFDDYVDHIFSQETTNTNVYEKVVGPIIESVLDGYHGTVFAYGQTSSGKTHTMMGNDADPGIIKRAIAYIFERIHKVSCSIRFGFW